MLNLQDLKKDVPLAPYTTYKIGGKADYFFTANSKEALVDAIRQSEEAKIPFFILGAGANILIGDKGFRGIVIRNQASSVKFNGNLLTAESGTAISRLINLSAERGLSGLEHFAGIPGTVGGAMRHNLHFLSPDRQSTIFIGSVVKSGIVLEDGKEKEVTRDYFEFGYDESALQRKKVTVLEITFELSEKDPGLIRAQIAENLRWREEKQPHLGEFPSCGSVFKKIEGVGAGRLIDQAGLKGKQIGGAQISIQHANFIVNTGKATAKDVIQLIKLSQEKIKKDTGYKLETEVEFVGEF